MHFASDRGLIELVKLLVEHGAKIDAVDEEQQTALDLAILCEHEDVVRYLRSVDKSTSSHNNI